jgi:hypothetical protein
VVGEAVIDAIDRALSDGENVFKGCSFHATRTRTDPEDRSGAFLSGQMKSIGMPLGFCDSHS